MATSRFVRPDTTTLSISGGDTLTVRNRLTVGERRAMFSRMRRDDVSFEPDRFKADVSIVVAYLLDWTLKGDDGRLVAIRELSQADLQATIDNLDPDSFDEITKVISDHVQAMKAEREQEKNKTDGATESSAISPSRKRSAGGLKTSTPSIPTSMAS